VFGTRTDLIAMLLAAQRDGVRCNKQSFEFPQCLIKHGAVQVCLRFVGNVFSDTSSASSQILSVVTLNGGIQSGQLLAPAAIPPCLGGRATAGWVWRLSEENCYSLTGIEPVSFTFWPSFYSD
jgi:hypothetical protein